MGTMDFKKKKEELEKEFVQLQELRNRTTNALIQLDLQIQQVAGKFQLLDEILNEPEPSTEEPTG